MGMEGPRRYITRPVVIILFLICVFLYYIVFPSGTNFSELSDEDEESDSFSKRSRELERGSKRGESFKKEKVSNPTDPNEFILGSKRYKLYEKKTLNFKQAESFCKKMDGRLAKTENLDEMRRLQFLLQKAKMVSDEIWIGVEKKQWKKHAWKDKAHPPGINPKALGEMNAMMMGGGKQEMCPALSSSTRALSPAMCLRQLPFVCEFDRVAKPKVEQKKVTNDPMNKYGNNKKDRKEINKGQKKVERTPKTRSKFESKIETVKRRKNDEM